MTYIVLLVRSGYNLDSRAASASYPRRMLMLDGLLVLWRPGTEYFNGSSTDGVASPALHWDGHHPEHKWNKLRQQGR